MVDFKQCIKDVLDFPTTGILFRDISPLLRNAELLSQAVQKMIEPYKGVNKITWVGVDARGFIFASYIAAIRQEGLVLIRKTGKMPPPFISESYNLEYGSNNLSIQPNTEGIKQAVIVDDVLATGGTLKACETLCKKAGYDLLGASVLITLNQLVPKVYNIAGKEVNTVMSYD